MGKAWEHLSREMRSGGREVDMGGVPDYKFMHNKLESEFLTGQAEYS